jgi:hypothetical protein
VANLLERTTLAWTVTAGASTQPELMTLGAYSVGHVTAAAPEQPTAATPVEVHAGRWSATRMLALTKMPASPPGLRADGLLGDWNMAAWLSGTPDGAMLGEAAWATAALIHHGVEDGGWWVYVECRSPGMKAKSEGPATADETVRVWLGPSGLPLAVLKASSAGSSLDELGRDRGTEMSRRARVVREDGRWVAQLPIPGACIDRDGTVWMAVERVDSRGRRSVWPRPMLPWQTEPGRAAVDTTAWGDASAAR